MSLLNNLKLSKSTGSSSGAKKDREAKGQSYRVVTEQILNLIEDLVDLKYGGEIINADNLIILDKEADWELLSTEGGCYFIFSSMQKSNLRTYGNYDCYNKKILKNNIEYGCIYNGDTQSSMKTRVAEHILNGKTLQAYNGGLSKKLEGKGCLSLESMSNVDFQNYHKIGALGAAEAYYKKVDKTSDRWFNGINIREKQWEGISFAAICISFEDIEFRSLIELLFRRLNGCPPLCKYVNKA